MRFKVCFQIEASLEIRISTGADHLQRALIKESGGIMRFLICMLILPFHVGVCRSPEA